VPVHEVWDFSVSQPGDLQILQGSWEWEKREKIGGGMKGTAKVSTVCLLPVKHVARPLQLTLTQPYPLGPDKLISLGAFWLKEGNTQRHQIYSSTRIMDPNTPLKLKLYLVDNYVVTYDKEVISLCEYEKSFIPESIAVCLDPAYFLSRMELHTIDPRDVPPFLQNIERLKNSLPKKRIQDAVKVRNQP
jgi:hypothetical protein